jgi:hypothetical protein
MERAHYTELRSRKVQLRRYFWWFVIIHSVLWIIVPTVFRFALPHDTIEGAMWGQHLIWGYDKNPWMNAWLTRLGFEIGGTSGIGIYALSSFFVGLSFWSVWKLAQKILSPELALISVLLLEGCINYTLVPQGFNDNVIELGLWPLMFLCFYNALSHQKILDWLGVGVVAGLAIMAKYYTGIPLFIMALFLMTYKETRISFRFSGIYVGLLAFIIVIFPHFIWLIQNNFITLKYAFDRASIEPINFWTLHFSYPLNFALSLIIDFLFPIILLFVIAKPKTEAIQNSNKFIFWMSFGPYILTILLAMIFGWHLYNEWGVPLVTLWGILLVMIFKPEISEKLFKRFLIIIYTIMFLWVIGYIIGLYIDHNHKHSDNYPAQEIANYVTQEWQERYHKPLRYVAGSRYIGGYLAFYSKDHPSVYVEWNPEFSPWINIDEMKKYGAIFIQDNYYGTTVFGKHPYTNNGKQFPSEVLKQYPNLIILPVKYFHWKRGNKDLGPIPVLVGFLSPD